MRRTLSVSRVIGVVHAPVLCNRALKPLQPAPLETLDVRLSWSARGYDHHAHHVLLCSIYRSASRSVFSFFSFARNSAGFSLCASAPLHLCASAPLFCSALVSVLLSNLLCSQSSTPLSSLCSALVSASRLSLVAHDHNTLNMNAIYSVMRFTITVFMQNCVFRIIIVQCDNKIIIL